MSEALVRTGLLEPRPAPRHVVSRELVAVRASPTWRGVLHEKAFALSPAFGLLLVESADGTRARIAATTFAATMTLMLGTSMLTHRTRVGVRGQSLLRRLDHAAISVFVAGTWTSIAMVVVPGTMRSVLTVPICGGAAVAMLLRTVLVRVPGWIPSTIALAGAWFGAAALPYVASAAGGAAVTLIVLGGGFYTGGAVVYGLRRRNPHGAFGHHEVFHALVLLGVACHYCALWLVVHSA